MKKHLLTVFSLIATFAFAQDKTFVPYEGVQLPASNIISNPSDQVFGACDTAMNFKKGDALGFYAADATIPLDSGFIFGHNKLLTKASAEKFTLKTANDLLSHIQLVFGYAKNNSNGNITAKVWDNTGPGGAPGAELASVQLPISSIIKNGYTTYQFTNPVKVTNTFYAGFSVDYGTMDTVGLYSSQYYKANPGNAWIQFANGSWYAYGTNFQINMYCWAFLCGSTVGLAPDQSNIGFELYPNPGTGIINITIPATFSNNTTLTVRNYTGQLISSELINNVATTTLNMSNQAKGVYFVSLQNGENVINQKLVIAE